MTQRNRRSECQPIALQSESSLTRASRTNAGAMTSPTASSVPFDTLPTRHHDTNGRTTGEPGCLRPLRFPMVGFRHWRVVHLLWRWGRRRSRSVVGGGHYQLIGHAPHPLRGEGRGADVDRLRPRYWIARSVPHPPSAYHRLLHCPQDMGHPPCPQPIVQGVRFTGRPLSAHWMLIVVMSCVSFPPIVPLYVCVEPLTTTRTSYSDMISVVVQFP